MQLSKRELHFFCLVFKETERFQISFHYSCFFAYFDFL